MNKIYIQKIALIGFAIFLNITLIIPVAFAGARDCDGNSVIYCGTLTKTELTNKLNNGTGKTYQTSKELKALFKKYGFDITDIPNLKEGRVTKTNQVLVANKVIATNVYTMGRHNISGSTKISGLSYPLYRRHPSVSFLSSSIDAYVYQNYDGSMAYGILKSCGNIVEGVGKRTRPAPPPTPTPLPETPEIPKISITVRKYNDVNHNGIREASESYLSGWQFRVTGKNVSETVTTDLIGQATLTELEQGDYTVTEILKDGWESTTGITDSHSVTTNTLTQIFVFGNYQPEVPEETPEIETGGGDTPPVILASAGLKENILIGVSAILALALLFYLSSRFYLSRVLRGGYVPTDPKKLIKELRDRTKKRHEKKITKIK